MNTMFRRLGTVLQNPLLRTIIPQQLQPLQPQQQLQPQRHIYYRTKFNVLDNSELGQASNRYKKAMLIGACESSVFDLFPTSKIYLHLVLSILFVDFLNVVLWTFLKLSWSFLCLGYFSCWFSFLLISGFYRKKKTGDTGDVIKVAVKGKMTRALIVGCRKPQKELRPRFDKNNVILLNEENVPIGTRVNQGPVSNEVRKRAGRAYPKVPDIVTRFIWRIVYFVMLVICFVITHLPSSHLVFSTKSWIRRSSTIEKFLLLCNFWVVIPETKQLLGLRLLVKEESARSTFFKISRPKELPWHFFPVRNERLFPMKKIFASDFKDSALACK